MIKIYKKDCDYSYTTGYFPTFELINNKNDILRYIYVSNDTLNTEAFKKLQMNVGKEKIIVSQNIFEKLKEKDNDHVIGVFSKYQNTLDNKDNHVVLVNPSDMGNLGNITRSMLAFDYKNLAIITPCCDIFNPKTIRASMGAIFSINFEFFSSFEEYIKKYPREYYPFMLQTNTYLHEVKKCNGPYSLVFGNEATGLDSSFLNKNAVKIEQSNKVDSLNLSTAVVLGLYAFKFLK